MCREKPLGNVSAGENEEDFLGGGLEQRHVKQACFSFFTQIKQIAIQKVNAHFPSLA